jgi:hypothetical protein
VVGEVDPSKLVGLVAKGENGLYGDVHDHHSLGTKLEGQNLQGVSNEQTRETHVIEGAEKPDEDKLCVARARVGAARVLIYGTTDGPEHEGGTHAASRDEEKRATAESVDIHGGRDGDNQVKDGLSSADLQRISKCSRTW